MPGNRKAAEKVVIDYIAKIVPSDKFNVEMYKQLFASMNDKEFEAWIKDLDENDGAALSFQMPNKPSSSLNLEHNLKLAAELGHSFFEHLWVTDPKTGVRYKTPEKYMILDLPIRRQAQLLVKKISIPSDNKSIDNLTGQPTGNSKGAKISYPEVQVMQALGLSKSLIEFMKYRGGDLDGFNAMNNAISNTGGVRLDALDQLGTETTSTITLKTVLTGMHLKSTL